MTEPPPPADDLPPPEPAAPEPRKDFDPRRRSVFPPSAQPSNEPIGFIQVVGLALLGILAFIVMLFVLTALVAATNPITGAVIAVVAIAALFAIRKRAGPSRVLGAFTIGAGIALVVFGGCMVLVFSMKR